MKSILIRQGDVMFRSVAKLPNGEHKKRENGTVAYGEATGHSHTVMSASTVDVLECADGLFLDVKPRGAEIEADIAKVEPWLRVIIEDADLALRQDMPVTIRLPLASAS